MNMKIVRGRAWLFGDNLDVDHEILPYRETYSKAVEELGRYCMTMVDPNFPKKVRKGDIMVTGVNMGYGHDHVRGPQAIKGCGISLVICESTNRNFFRNCIHVGLPIIEYEKIREEVQQGDELEIDLYKGTIKNIRSGKVLMFQPYPDFILDILDSDGLYPYLRKRIAEGKIQT